MADESPEISDRGDHAELKPWTYGLFGCIGDCRRCLCGYLCPCWLFHMNAARVGQACGGVWWMIPGLNFFCCLKVRGMVRNRRHVAGGTLGDCCVHGFCHPCAIVQEARELDEEVRARMQEMTVPPYVDKQPTRTETEENAD